MTAARSPSPRRDRARLIDAATGAEPRAWPALRAGPAPGLLADGRWLAALGHDRTMTVADTASGRETVLGSTTVGKIGLGNETGPRGGRGRPDRLGRERPAERRGHGPGRPHTPRLAHGQFTIRSIAVSPDGRRLASGHYEGQVHLWDANTPGTSQADWLAHASRVTALAFAPDGRTLATGGSDGAVALWDVATGRRNRTVEGAPSVRSRPWSFPTTSATLASSDARGVARLWDLSGPGPSRRLKSDVPPAPIFHLAYSPDGRWLATAMSRPPRLSAGPVETARTPWYALTDRGGEVWDALTGKLVYPLQADPGHVYRVAFAPDSRTLATGGRDSVVKLWDVATGQLVRVAARRPPDPLNYPQDAVGGAAFST